MERIALVTGGTGFIGWHLCERLRDSGWRVRAAVRPTSPNPLPEGVERVGAALEAEALAHACSGARVVFHLAGLTRAPSYEAFARVNVEGARQVALAAAAAGCAMVNVSSQAAGGPGTPLSPRSESDAPAPVSVYGRSKLAGERAVASVAGIRAVHIRPPGVYGPRDRDFLPLFLLARRGWFPLLAPPRTAYTLVYVHDLIEALIRVGEALAGGRADLPGETFFVGHPEPVTVGELRQVLAEVLQRRVRALPVPRPLLWVLAEVGELQGRFGRPGLMNRSRYREITAPGFVCDVSRIERVLGIRAATDVRRGFAATARWYLERGWLH